MVRVKLLKPYSFWVSDDILVFQQNLNMWKLDFACYHGISDKEMQILIKDKLAILL